MMRIPRKSLAGKFERRDGLLARHRRKRLQEIVKRISGFKIVEKVLHGNARADKNGLAALDVRIAVNHDLLHTMAQSISETRCTRFLKPQQAPPPASPAARRSADSRPRKSPSARSLSDTRSGTSRCDRRRSRRASRRRSCRAGGRKRRGPRAWRNVSRRKFPPRLRW